VSPGRRAQPSAWQPQQTRNLPHAESTGYDEPSYDELGETH